VPSDGELDRIIEPYALAMNSSPKFLLTKAYANVAVTGGILRNNPGGGDSQLGNMVATSMRLQSLVQADFSMTNSLGIRTDFSAGPLTEEELFNVFPFDNTITVIYLSGTEVQQMFDFIAAKSASRGCKTQAQVSGIGVVMDCSVPPHLPDGRPCDPDQYRTSENLGFCYQGAADVILIGSQHPCITNADCVAPGGNNEVCGNTLGICTVPATGAGSRKVCDLANPNCATGETCAGSNLNVCGKLLNPQGVYRVAVNDYVAAGGSGFTMLQFNTSKVNTGLSLRSSIADYIQRMDDPHFEGPYGCTGTPSAATCHGAIRCDDPRWTAVDPVTNKPVDPYLALYGTVSPDVTYSFCPGKTTVGDCFGHSICVLPHNSAIDGRVHPRFQ
jgi:hypothetical protein